jgi:signal peptidase I
MGDNRRAGGSVDSRTFGPVPKERIEGRAEWNIWPIADIGGL